MNIPKLLVVAAALLSLFFNHRVSARNEAEMPNITHSDPSVVIIRNVRVAIMNKENLIITPFNSRDGNPIRVVNLQRYEKKIDEMNVMDLHIKQVGRKWRIIDIQDATYKEAQAVAFLK